MAWIPTGILSLLPGASKSPDLENYPRSWRNAPSPLRRHRGLSVRRQQVIDGPGDQRPLAHPAAAAGLGFPCEFGFVSWTRAEKTAVWHGTDCGRCARRVRIETVQH